jgi:hypothetical protein
MSSRGISAVGDLYKYYFDQGGLFYGRSRFRTWADYLTLAVYKRRISGRFEACCSGGWFPDNMMKNARDN